MFTTQIRQRSCRLGSSRGSRKQALRVFIRHLCDQDSLQPPTSALVSVPIGPWVFQGAKACRSRSRALGRQSKCLVKLGNLVPDPAAIDVRLERLP